MTGPTGFSRVAPPMPAPRAAQAYSPAPRPRWRRWLIIAAAILAAPFAIAMVLTGLSQERR